MFHTSSTWPPAISAVRDFEDTIEAQSSVQRRRYGETYFEGQVAKVEYGAKPIKLILVNMGSRPVK